MTKIQTILLLIDLLLSFVVYTNPFSYSRCKGIINSRSLLSKPDNDERSQYCAYDVRSFNTHFTRRKIRASRRMATVERGQQPLDFSADDGLRTQVSTLIDHLQQQESITGIDPEVLEKFVPALCKGDIYSQVMRNKAKKEMSDSEYEKLKKIDAFLKGFISQKKVKRSRETVQQILSSATETPEDMDLKMGSMAEQGFLDQDCLDYIVELVHQEKRKQKGQQPSLLLRVLTIIQERIEAEVKMKGRPEVRALSFLVRIDDAAEREIATRKAFTTKDQFENFQFFLKDGIEYFNTRGTGVLMASKLPQDAVDRMQHISQIIEDIITE
mmetsp:Transcript_38812/g.49035  ORF Transcript_38812/g.49035 Transcript_38812/m.49035 type:complete len:327 (+) Transcript_38812:92-1072(+)